MKNSTLRAAALLLAALTVVPTVASCGGETGTTDTQAVVTDAQSQVETVDPNDRSQIKDNLPDDLDFSGRT